MTTSDIVAIRAQVIRLNLDGCNTVSALSIDELASAFNGTGPSFFPTRIRAKLDNAARPLLPAIMVHDVDFQKSTGREDDFHSANDRLLRNAIRCACDDKPWYSLKRYALVIEAYALYLACERFGWIAWLSALYTPPKNTNRKDKQK